MLRALPGVMRETAERRAAAMIHTACIPYSGQDRLIVHKAALRSVHPGFSEASYADALDYGFFVMR